MNVGPVIRDIRRAQHLKLIDVARIAELSPSHLSLIERGARDPSLTVLARIADTLKVPVSVIVLLASREREPSGGDNPLALLDSAIRDLIHALEPAQP
ncbi:MAG: helix-turn-helix transcriptional regulator [Chromatiales bacterium]|nr:helix-turn-helix transcriptional regulator [Chromatiales bacterium]